MSSPQKIFELCELVAHRKISSADFFQRYKVLRADAHPEEMLDLVSQYLAGLILEGRDKKISNTRTFISDFKNFVKASNESPSDQLGEA